MKTSVIATLPSGRASYVFEGTDWIYQARKRWPDATEFTGTPVCPTCERGEWAHEGDGNVVQWCKQNVRIV